MKTLPTHLNRLEAALGKQGVALKRHQLLEVCAAAFGYRNSNECTAAAKRGALDPAKAVRLGDARFDGIELAVVLDPIANAPYALESKHLGDGFAVTPFGNLVDLREAAKAVSAPLRGHWEDHPQYPYDDWAYEVANGDTRRSYSEWVEAKIEENGEDPDGDEPPYGWPSDAPAAPPEADHPVHGSAQWRADVDKGDTHKSYADWVKERLAEDAERAGEAQGDTQVTFLTNGCCESAHGTPELLAAHGLKWQTVDGHFYPLTADEEEFIAEDEMVLPNGYTVLMGYSVLHKGAKYACPVVTRFLEPGSPEAHAAAKAEVSAYRDHIAPKIEAHGGLVLWGEEQDDRICLNVLYPFKEIRRACAEYMDWAKVLVHQIMPKDGPRVTARFHPEAWIRNQAVGVDPEGEDEWDVTHIVVADEAAAVAIEDGRDSSDDLRDDPSAPEWIRKWAGPFRIEVKDSISDYFETLKGPSK